MTQRLTAHLQDAEWWLVGWKSIVEGKTPSKLSMAPTSCYCRQHLCHKADVSPGTTADAGGFSLISIRAMNYKSPLCSLMGTVWSQRGAVIMVEKQRFHGVCLLHVRWYMFVWIAYCSSWAIFCTLSESIVFSVPEFPQPFPNMWEGSNYI